MECLPRLVLESELQQDFAKAGQRVLVLGIEHQRLLEAAPRPRILFAGQTGVANPHMQFYRVRIEREPFAKDIERLIVMPLVIELMSALIVLLRTQEWSRHLSNFLRFERAGLLYHSERVWFNTLVRRTYG